MLGQALLSLHVSSKLVVHHLCSRLICTLWKMQAIATEATVVWYLMILLLQQWNDKCLFPSHWNYESKERMIDNLCQCKKNTIQSILHWNFVELRCLIEGKGMYNLGYLQRRNRMELKFLSCKSSGSERCLRVNYLQSLGILLFLLHGCQLMWKIIKLMWSL